MTAVTRSAKYDRSASRCCRYQHGTEHRDTWTSIEYLYVHTHINTGRLATVTAAGVFLSVRRNTRQNRKRALRASQRRTAPVIKSEYVDHRRADLTDQDHHRQDLTDQDHRRRYVSGFRSPSSGASFCGVSPASFCGVSPTLAPMPGNGSRYPKNTPRRTPSGARLTYTDTAQFGT